MSRGGDDLFSRWSRRKRAVETEKAGPKRDARVADADRAPDGADEALSEKELLEKLGLPDPDSLKPGDDFASFMKEQVPEALRRRALRRLWPSNPVLANLDGLVDYAEDFTDAATVPDKLVTAYQVGRGILREVLAGDAADTAKAAPPAGEAEEEVPASQNDTIGESTADSTSCEKSMKRDASQNSAGTDAEAETPLPPQPRRMSFRTT